MQDVYKVVQSTRYFNWRWLKFLLVKVNRISGLNKGNFKEKCFNWIPSIENTKTISYKEMLKIAYTQTPLNLTSNFGIVSCQKRDHLMPRSRCVAPSKIPGIAKNIRIVFSVSYFTRVCMWHCNDDAIFISRDHPKHRRCVASIRVVRVCWCLCAIVQRRFM